jgi:tetratricopeptide (TPR) repeat protein
VKFKGVLITVCSGVLVVGLLVGCATMPDGQRPPVVDQGVETPAPASQTGDYVDDYGKPQPPAAQPPAVLALLDRAEQQANAGELGSAAVTLERAIRIDSRNPVLWHHLASVRLAEGESAQAEQLAAKSNSLAPGNRPLQARNWQLIAEARRSRGDTAGARAAEQRVRELEAE